MKILMIIILIVWCYSVFYVTDAITTAFSEEIKTAYKKLFRK